MIWPKSTNKFCHNSPIYTQRLSNVFVDSFYHKSIETDTSYELYCYRDPCDYFTYKTTQLSQREKSIILDLRVDCSLSEISKLRRFSESEFLESEDKPDPSPRSWS